MEIFPTNPESGILAEGYLGKAGTHHWKRRYFVLVGNSLVYYRHQTSTEKSGQLRVDSSLNVQFCLPNTNGYTFNFPVIELLTDNHCWVLATPSGGRDDHLLFQWYEKIMMSRSIEEMIGGEEGETEIGGIEHVESDLTYESKETQGNNLFTTTSTPSANKIVQNTARDTSSMTWSWLGHAYNPNLNQNSNPNPSNNGVHQHIQEIQERSSSQSSTQNNETLIVGGSSFEMYPRYIDVKPLGHGAYGVVVSALDRETNKRVAIKKCPSIFDDISDAKRIARELRLLRHFNHKNIMRVINIIPPSTADFNDVYFAAELMDTDLHRVITSRQNLSENHIQYFLYQILCGIKYVHSADVIHRDLKPSNILLNENCSLKVCDFGLARQLSNIQIEEENQVYLTEYVVTRWYRAPEVMLSSQQYSKAIDVWSIGCIFGEMLGRRVLFPGKDYIHQLRLITSIIGTPTSKDELWFVSNIKAIIFMLELPKSEPKDMKLLFPAASDLAIDLLQRMLELDPRKRITIDEALDHKYFEGIRQPEVEKNTLERVEWGSIEIHHTKPALQMMIVEDAMHYHPDVEHLREFQVIYQQEIEALMRAQQIRSPIRSNRVPVGNNAITKTTNPDDQLATHTHIPQIELIPEELENEKVMIGTDMEVQDETDEDMENTSDHYNSTLGSVNNINGQSVNNQETVHFGGSISETGSTIIPNSIINQNNHSIANQLETLIQDDCGMQEEDQPVSGSGFLINP